MRSALGVLVPEHVDVLLLERLRLGRHVARRQADLRLFDIKARVSES